MKGVARMSTEIPATIGADDVTAWSDDVDVVVIGFGIAGGCAAVSAAAAGARVPVLGELGGASMVVDLLLKRADALGVQIRYETGVTNLVTDDDGAVVGVAWKHFTETGVLKANSVIIAAGGFAMNPEMVAEHTPA